MDQQPVEWKEGHSAKHNRKFWKNVATDQTTWKNPYKDQDDPSNLISENPINDVKEKIVIEQIADQGVDQSVISTTAESSQQIDEWEERFSDKHNRKYWKNINTKESTWKDPHKTEKKELPIDENLSIAPKVSDTSPTENNEKVLDVWVEGYSEKHKRRYWKNGSTGQTIWKDPNLKKDESKELPVTSNNPNESNSDDWIEHFSEKHDRKFWKNKLTGETRWKEPPKAKEVTQIEEPVKFDVKTEATPQSNDEWIESFRSKHQKKFWKNKSTGASTWKDPTVQIEGSVKDNSKEDIPSKTPKWEKKYSEKHQRNFWKDKISGEVVWKEPVETDQPVGGKGEDKKDPLEKKIESIETTGDVKVQWTGSAKGNQLVKIGDEEWVEHYHEKYKRKYWKSKTNGRIVWKYSETKPSQSSPEKVEGVTTAPLMRVPSLRQELKAVEVVQQFRDDDKMKTVAVVPSTLSASPTTLQQSVPLRGMVWIIPKPSLESTSPMSRRFHPSYPSSSSHSGPQRGVLHLIDLHYFPLYNGDDKSNCQTKLEIIPWQDSIELNHGMASTQSIKDPLVDSSSSNAAAATATATTGSRTDTKMAKWILERKHLKTVTIDENFGELRIILNEETISMHSSKQGEGDGAEMEKQSSRSPAHDISILLPDSTQSIVRDSEDPEKASSENSYLSRDETTHELSVTFQFYSASLAQTWCMALSSSFQLDRHIKGTAPRLHSTMNQLIDSSHATMDELQSQDSLLVSNMILTFQSADGLSTEEAIKTISVMLLWVETGFKMFSSPMMEQLSQIGGYDESKSSGDGNNQVTHRLMGVKNILQQCREMLTSLDATQSNEAALKDKNPRRSPQSSSALVRNELDPSNFLMLKVLDLQSFVHLERSEDRQTGFMNGVDYPDGNSMNSEWDWISTWLKLDVNDGLISFHDHGPSTIPSVVINCRPENPSQSKPHTTDKSTINGAHVMPRPTLRLVSVASKRYEIHLIHCPLVNAVRKTYLSLALQFKGVVHFLQWLNKMLILFDTFEWYQGGNLNHLRFDIHPSANPSLTSLKRPLDLHPFPIWKSFSLDAVMHSLSSLADQSLVQGTVDRIQTSGSILKSAVFKESRNRLVMMSVGSCASIPIGSVLISINGLSCFTNVPSTILRFIADAPNSLHLDVIFWTFPRCIFIVDVVNSASSQDNINFHSSYRISKYSSNASDATTLQPNEVRTARASDTVPTVSSGSYLFQHSNILSNTINPYTKVDSQLRADTSTGGNSPSRPNLTSNWNPFQYSDNLPSPINPTFSNRKDVGAENLSKMILKKRHSMLLVKPSDELIPSKASSIESNERAIPSMNPSDVIPVTMTGQSNQPSLLPTIHLSEIFTATLQQAKLRGIRWKKARIVLFDGELMIDVKLPSQSKRVSVFQCSVSQLQFRLLLPVGHQRIEDICIELSESRRIQSPNPGHDRRIVLKCPNLKLLSAFLVNLLKAMKLHGSYPCQLEWMYDQFSQKKQYKDHPSGFQSVRRSSDFYNQVKDCLTPSQQLSLLFRFAMKESTSRQGNQDLTRVQVDTSPTPSDSNTSLKTSELIGSPSPRLTKLMQRRLGQSNKSEAKSPMNAIPTTSTPQRATLQPSGMMLPMLQASRQHSATIIQTSESLNLVLQEMKLPKEFPTTSMLEKIIRGLIRTSYSCHMMMADLITYQYRIKMAFIRRNAVQINDTPHIQIDNSLTHATKIQNDNINNSNGRTGSISVPIGGPQQYHHLSRDSLSVSKSNDIHSSLNYLEDHFNAVFNRIDKEPNAASSTADISYGINSEDGLEVDYQGMRRNSTDSNGRRTSVSRLIEIPLDMKLMPMATAAPTNPSTNQMSSGINGSNSNSNPFTSTLKISTTPSMVLNHASQSVQKPSASLVNGQNVLKQGAGSIQTPFFFEPVKNQLSYLTWQELKHLGLLLEELRSQPSHLVAIADMLHHHTNDVAFLANIVVHRLYSSCSIQPFAMKELLTLASKSKEESTSHNMPSIQSPPTDLRSIGWNQSNSKPSRRLTRLSSDYNVSNQSIQSDAKPRCHQGTNPFDASYFYHRLLIEVGHRVDVKLFTHILCADMKVQEVTVSSSKGISEISSSIIEPFCKNLESKVSESLYPEVMGHCIESIYRSHNNITIRSFLINCFLPHIIEYIVDKLIRDHGMLLKLEDFTSPEEALHHPSLTSSVSKPQSAVMVSADGSSNELAIEESKKNSIPFHSPSTSPSYETNRTSQLDASHLDVVSSIERIKTLFLLCFDVATTKSIDLCLLDSAAMSRSKWFIARVIEKLTKLGIPLPGPLQQSVMSPVATLARMKNGHHTMESSLQRPQLMESFICIQPVELFFLLDKWEVLSNVDRHMLSNPTATSTLNGTYKSTSFTVPAFPGEALIAINELQASNFLQKLATSLGFGSMPSLPDEMDNKSVRRSLSYDESAFPKPSYENGMDPVSGIRSTSWLFGDDERSTLLSSSVNAEVTFVIPMHPAVWQELQLNVVSNQPFIAASHGNNNTPTKRGSAPPSLHRGYGSKEDLEILNNLVQDWTTTNPLIVNENDLQVMDDKGGASDELASLNWLITAGRTSLLTIYEDDFGDNATTNRSVRKIEELNELRENLMKKREVIMKCLADFDELFEMQNVCNNSEAQLHVLLDQTRIYSTAMMKIPNDIHSQMPSMRHPHLIAKFIHPSVDSIVYSQVFECLNSLHSVTDSLRMVSPMTVTKVEGGEASADRMLDWNVDVIWGDDYFKALSKLFHSQLQFECKTRKSSRRGSSRAILDEETQKGKDENGWSERSLSIDRETAGPNPLWIIMQNVFKNKNDLQCNQYQM